MHRTGRTLILKCPKHFQCGAGITGLKILPGREISTLYRVGLADDAFPDGVED